MDAWHHVSGDPLEGEGGVDDVVESEGRGGGPVEGLGGPGEGGGGRGVRGEGGGGGRSGKGEKNNNNSGRVDKLHFSPRATNERAQKATN